MPRHVRRGQRQVLVQQEELDAVKRPTQLQMYYAAERRAAKRDQEFLTIAFHPNNPMTQRDLKRLIERRPELWGRYEGYLPKLPA